MTRAAGVFIVFASVVGFLLGLVAASGGPRPVTTATALHPADAPPLNLASHPAPVFAPTTGAAVDFAAVAARVNAAVVNVDAAVRGDGRGRPGPRWRRDMVDDPGAPREGSGSGFFIDPSGYLLTNFHVVDGADRITVTLVDGRAFRAELVGVDPLIDVALLKINATEDVPVAVLGDSQSLRPGQWVCAIGNPLGYVHSVTVGVISFLGRKLFNSTLDAYIQTDAAISLGNSGGPLIDSEGRVVGITTAISAQAANIGFAIPISQVVPVLQQLRERGRVSRGYLGIGLTQVTPALQRALGLGADRGALVQEVTPETPAERSGLRAYDVIVSVDELPVRSDEELIRAISALAPGTTVRLGVMRDAERRSLQVKLTERPLPESARPRLAESDVRPASGPDFSPLGLTVRDLDRATRMRLQLPDTLGGVVVADVDAAGPARLARVRAGHVLLEINRRRISSTADYLAALAALRPGEVAAVLLYDQAGDQRVLTAIVPDVR
jgi:serine protease Do